ncbi:unnamed protein product [Lota lota]
MLLNFDFKWGKHFRPSQRAHINNTTTALVTLIRTAVPRHDVVNARSAFLWSNPIQPIPSSSVFERHIALHWDNDITGPAATAGAPRGQGSSLLPKIHPYRRVRRHPR